MGYQMLDTDSFNKWWDIMWEGYMNHGPHCTFAEYVVIVAERLVSEKGEG